MESDITELLGYIKTLEAENQKSQTKSSDRRNLSLIQEEDDENNTDAE
jgi:hypothetical protein